MNQVTLSVTMLQKQFGRRKEKLGILWVLIGVQPTGQDLKISLVKNMYFGAVGFARGSFLPA